MRVIAGTAKGRVLFAPKGIGTRPILSMIKESLFNIWQEQVKSARFLDLFAGSGSIGIEALSREAKEVVFVEKNRSAVSIIRKNLALCQFQTGWSVYQDDVFQRLKKLSKDGQKFDIVYIDPPFTVKGIFQPVMNALSDSSVLSDQGIAAIRTRREMELPDVIGSLKKFRLKSYDISSIHFYSPFSAITPHAHQMVDGLLRLDEGVSV